MKEVCKTEDGTQEAEELRKNFGDNSEEVGFDALLKAMEEADEVTDHPECTIDNPDCETCSG